MKTPTAIPLVILGVPFHPYTNQETRDWCVQYIKKRTPGYVATPNLDFVMQAGRDPELSRILAQATLVIPDGMPIVWLSGRLGPKLQERVAGSDLILALSEAAAREKFKVFHLGGAPGVPEKAGQVLEEKFPGFILAGAYSPPKAELLDMNHSEILQRLEEAKPDILYVAFGAPKQEKWIHLHFRNWEIPLALGLGGSLDFLAGTQKRAPKWMQTTGTEWIWRLGTNPKRLWKRYSANFRFLFEALGKINAIKKLDHRPVPAAFPKDEEGNPDTRFISIPWMNLTTQEMARDFMTDAENTMKGNHAVFDFTQVTWLSSLEMGVLVLLGRNAKIRRQYLLRTGCCERLDRWMTFNLLDPLVEPFDPATDWNKRLNEREHLEVKENTARPGAFGSPKTRKQLIRISEKKTCMLYPPEELSALTVEEWKTAVLPTLEILPADIRAIHVDAAELRFLDSAGLGFFMALKKLAQSQQKAFKVLNLKNAPLTTVKLARVEKLLLPVNHTSRDA